MTFGQRVAVCLRLQHQLQVSFGSGLKKRQGTVGLKAHREGRCLCARYPAEWWRIDWHGPGDTESAPHDFAQGCPARFWDWALAGEINEAMSVEALGGLHVYAGVGLALLPARVVSFYQLVLGARDRLFEERDALWAKLSG